jgi:hypothetical protein
MQSTSWSSEVRYHCRFVPLLWLTPFTVEAEGDWVTIQPTSLALFEPLDAIPDRLGQQAPLVDIEDPSPVAIDVSLLRIIREQLEEAQERRRIAELQVSS